MVAEAERLLFLLRWFLEAVCPQGKCWVAAIHSLVSFFFVRVYYRLSKKIISAVLPLIGMECVLFNKHFINFGWSILK